MNEILLNSSESILFDKMQLLTVAGIPAGSIIGHSVSVNGDGSTALIGSRVSDVVSNDGGSAYIYS